MLEFNQDWYQGDDPGVTAWPVTGGDGSFITTTNNAWALQVFDITGATPETALTASGTPAGHNGAAGTSIYFTQLAAPVVDGYWTKGGSGYNWRSYVPNAGYQVAGNLFVAGHEYRFVWTVTTPDYDGTANKWGKVTLVRAGKCLSKK